MYVANIAFSVFPSNLVGEKICHKLAYREPVRQFFCLAEEHEFCICLILKVFVLSGPRGLVFAGFFVGGAKV
ncbi:MAG: hypothetical protein D6790_21915 [Caldilineae bacterium]|nr:MAG: hypothetical protein D6790_21915 [Caldilineae bacterium]